MSFSSKSLFGDFEAKATETLAIFDYDLDNKRTSLYREDSIKRHSDIQRKYTEVEGLERQKSTPSQRVRRLGIRCCSCVFVFFLSTCVFV